MDALTKLFPALVSVEFMQVLTSMALAALVFFYFIHLLRKEEVAAQAD